MACSTSARTFAAMTCTLMPCFTLGALFASPGITEVFDTWRTRYPYKAAWVNHEALA